MMTPKTSLANSILDINQITQPIIGETCHQITLVMGMNYAYILVK
jgi:hypothetical protein